MAVVSSHKSTERSGRTGGKLLTGAWPRVLISLSILLVYLRTVSFGFTYFDDESLVLNNLAGLSSLKNIILGFNGELTRGFTAFYRPLLTASFIINYQLSGLAAWGYHLINVLLHLTACLLFYKLLTKLHAGPGRALFFSLLFAVHPLNAQAVAWIPGRNDSLLAVFALPMLMLFMDFAATGKLRYLFLNSLFFALALLTKESALVMPVLCLGYFFLVPQRPRHYQKLVLNAVLWFAIFLSWYWARNNALGFSPEGQAGRFIAPIEFFAGVLSYLGKALLPINLSPVAGPEIGSFFYGTAALALLSGLVWRVRLKNKSFFLFGLLWAALFLLPNMIRGSFITLALEHRFYLPFMGLLAAFSQVNQFKFETAKTKTAMVPGLVILIAAFGTFWYSTDFKDRETFWTAAGKKSPQNSLVHYNRGLLFQEKGKYDQAEREYQTALGITPDYAGVHNNLGILYQMQGKHGPAEQQFKKALQYRPNLAEALDNLGSVYYQQNLPDQAREQFEKAIRANPRLASAHNNLGSLYFLSGKLPEAEREFGEAVRLKPDWAEAQANLGSVHLKVGSYDQAEREYLKALSLDGGNQTASYNLAEMYISQGSYQKAQNLLQAILRIRPENPLFHEQLSYVCYLRKDYNQAVIHYDQALKLGAAPDPAVLAKLKPYRSK
ncbi:MAG: tetratricopeptide repeat protein [bacterium]|nr:tetratricopeptide repeat protein [bacterium]